jgi:Flp pilus assembly protein TadB
MEPTVVIAGIVVLVVIALFFGYTYIRSSSRRDNLRALMRQSEESFSSTEESTPVDESDPSALPAVEESALRKQKPNSQPTLEERMFHAGMFAEEQKADFKRLQVLLPVVLGIVGAIVGASSADPMILILGPVAGVILGILVPLKMLDMRGAKRDEDIMFYLPLVVEQISIGVSSSLDIGPCLARVVEMADERNSHNAVTELLRYAQFFIKSGVSLQDALNEVGRLSGNNDIKHSFKALAQVARYGGEISKQLQDLSEAVSSTREMRVDEKIKKLELAATAPVALVFAGFLGILMIGFGMSMAKGLGGG